VRVLVVEDDPNKLRQICSYLRDTYASVRVSERRSYRSGLDAALNEEFDVVVLDMSMPTYDISPGEKGGRNRPYGGRDILAELHRTKRRVRVVVVTQFESFGEGTERLTLSELRAQLAARYPQIYAGIVFYQPSETAWREELSAAIGAGGRK